MAERCHFCFVNPNAGSRIMETGLPAGGAETQVVALADGLVGRGHQVSILTLLNEETLSIRHKGVQWVHVPFEYLQGRRGRVVHDWTALWRRMWELQPDFVFLKHPRHLLCHLVVWGKINRSRVFFHASIDRDFSAQLLAEEPIVARQMYRWGLKFADGVLSQTRTQERELRLLTKSPVYYLPSICSCDLPYSRGVEDNEYFLWVGSNSARKRPHLFLKLARKLPDYRFVMVFQPGDGTGAIDPKNGPTNVHYVSSCPREEIWKCYMGASALISTSALEGFPNVFLESWACKKPVISFGFDPDDVIATRNIGRVAHNFDDLLAHVKEFAHDSHLTKRLGAAAYNYLEEHHLPEVVIPRFLSIIEEYKEKGLE